MDISSIYGKTLELEGLLLLLKEQDACSEKALSIHAALKEIIAEISVDIDMMQRQHFSRPMPVEEAEIRQEDDDAAVERAEAQEAEAEAVNEPIAEAAVAEAEEESFGEGIEATASDEEISAENAEIKVAADPQSKEPESAVYEVAKSQDEPHDDSVEIVVAQQPFDVNQSTFARATNGDIRKAFTLNDTYKFRRELFANSQAEFKGALDKVERMTSTVEADDYFYGHLDFDKESDEVKDFMNIIYAYLSGK